MSRNESLRTVDDVRVAALAVQKQSLLRVACLILSVSASACGRGCGDSGRRVSEDDRGEARSLLEQLTDLSDKESLQQRQARLEQLAGLKLAAAPNRQARDACRNAYQGLLDAEIAQASAKKALEQLSEKARAGAAITPEQGRAVGADIERSNGALAAAKTGLPACEQAMRELLGRAR